MGADSKIEWTDHTFNPWVGCSKVSPACDHCYAESWAKRSGLVTWGGPRKRTSPTNWGKPGKWQAEARAAGVRARVFCASLADVFDNQVPPEWRTDLFRVIHATPDLDWLLLTKRIGNVPNALTVLGDDTLPSNVWLGITIANQEEADRDIPKLLSVSATVRFLSCEPLLGPIDLRYLTYDSGDRLPEEMRVNSGRCSLDALRGVTTWPGSHYQSPTIKEDVRFIEGKLFQSAGESRHIDWTIVGGESGPGARPMTLGWARDLVRQCQAADVPVFVKQLGAKPVDREDIPYPISDRKGALMDEWPESLRVREFPHASR